MVDVNTIEKKDFLEHPVAVINTANFRNCKKLNCLFIDHCKKEHANNIRPVCIHPEEQIIYDIQKIFNATGSTFITNILNHWAGVSTPVLEFDRLILTTYNPIPTGESTLDALVLVEKDVTKSVAYPSVVSTATVLTSEGNTDTALVTGTPTLRNTFNIDSVGDFNEGDAVQFVQSSPLPIKKDLEIIDITGSTITLDKDLDAVPVAGNQLIQTTGRLYLVDENDTVISVFSYRRQKTSDQQIAIVYTATLKGS